MLRRTARRAREALETAAAGISRLLKNLLTALDSL
jgi:hypothetical protein